MDIYTARVKVKEMYPNDTWARHVDKMPDEQVLAIYFRNMQRPVELPQKEEPPAQGRLF